MVTNLAQEWGGEGSRLMTEGAVDRLVLASGGVARDFLSIFRMSLDVARERICSHPQHGNKITAEDVNVAAGGCGGSKREEGKRGTADDDPAPDPEVQRGRHFFLR